MKMTTIEIVTSLWIFFIGLGLLSTCAAQPGFVSIDCGKMAPDYVDGLGISWSNDSAFTAAGVSGAVSGTNSQLSWPLNSTLRDFRFFPERRPKQCYQMAVLENATYIVRAMFLHGRHPLLEMPVSFAVTINATMWISLEFNDSSTLGFTNPVVKEAVIRSAGTVVYVCLVPGPGSGSPFISSLELRRIQDPNVMSPFDHMAHQEDWTGRYLRDGSRYNCGADPGAADVRYPDDSLDRMWESPDLSNATYPNMKAIAGSGAVTTTNSTEDLIVPRKVMEDAWGADGQHSMAFGHQVAGANGFYALVSTKELHPSNGSIPRGMKISLNVDGITSFAINATASHDPNLVRHVNASARLHRLELITALPASWSGRVTVAWDREEWSTVGPVANALEMYTVADWDSSRTHDRDGMAVLESLRSGLNLTKWHFDPCFPVPESWIECNVTSGTVVKINITGNKLPFDLSDASLTSELWSLESLETVVMDRTNISAVNLSLWHESLRRIEAGAPGSSIKLFSLVNSSISTITPAFNVLASQIAATLCSPHANALKGGILLGGNPFCEDARKFLGEQYLLQDIEMAYRYVCRFSEDEMPPSDMRFCSTNDGNFGVAKHHVIIVVSTTLGALTILSICICLGTIWKMRKQKNTFDQLEKEQDVQPRFYSYDDLKNATRDFHQDLRLGYGAFGEVYEGKLEDGTTVAVKRLFNTKQVLDEFLKEVMLITAIQHRNLLQLKGCCIKDNHRMLVYEFAVNESLARTTSDGKTSRMFLQWRQRFGVCLGMARGLSYLHEGLQPQIIHGNVKPTNIVLDEDLNPKIADFGFSRALWDDETRLQPVHLAGTLGYLSPEYATQGQPTEKVDVYSYGVLVLETVSGRKCIEYSQPSEQVFLVNWAQYLYEEGETALMKLLDPNLRGNWQINEPEVTRMLKIGLSCLQTDPTRRPSMSLVVSMLLGTVDVMELSDLRDRANQMSFGSFQRDSSELLDTFSDTDSFTDFSVVAERKESELPLFTTISRRDSYITYNFDHRLPTAVNVANESCESDETPLNPSSITAKDEISRER
ncbi:hypothetical protein Mapa_003942 [Marchantia paleacea]|nr:hypothetical protein Mapa_003942 [Marchantia paleacea]